MPATGTDLVHLVTEIRQEWDAIDAHQDSVMQHARSLGKLLVRAKKEVGHGKWKGWIEDNFHRSERQAARYMLVAKAKKDARESSISKVSEPHRPRSHSKPSATMRAAKDATADIDFEKLAAERKAVEREQKLIHETASKIINVGYRVLATKMHPDVAGGSEDSMRRLNAARRILQDAL